MRTRMILSLAGMLWSGAAAAIPNNVTLSNFFGTLTFNRPVQFAQVPGKDSTYVVLEQLAGAVTVVRRVAGVWTKSALFTAPVVTNQNQMGLLGLAFHPQYTVNRKYYLHYNPNSSTTLIVERVADTSLVLDGGTPSRTVLSVTQPNTTSNGGHIAFGPDGYLYIGLGDGGGTGDPQNRGQSMTDLLAKMLRVDVDGPDAYPADDTRNYAVPADNPFVATAAAGFQAIWALGLRNPWRWSFHPVTGELWVGDVGQSNTEEVSRVPRGGNMGWRIQEGAGCFEGGSCNMAGLTQPALSLARSLANAIVGGEFFVGDPAGEFHNTYIFGENGGGRIWAARDSAGTITEYVQLLTLANVSSFARAHGQVFALHLGTSNGMNINMNSGRVMLLSSPDMIPVPVGIRPGSRGRAGANSISRHDLLHSGRYQVLTLDGRSAPPGARGVFLARERGSAAPPRLVTVVD